MAIKNLILKEFRIKLEDLDDDFKKCLVLFYNARELIILKESHDQRT